MKYLIAVSARSTFLLYYLNNFHNSIIDLTVLLFLYAINNKDFTD